MMFGIDETSFALGYVAGLASGGVLIGVLVYRLLRVR